MSIDYCGHRGHDWVRLDDGIATCRICEGVPATARPADDAREDQA
jgi:hypothetical protein